MYFTFVSACPTIHLFKRIEESQMNKQERPVGGQKASTTDSKLTAQRKKQKAKNKKKAKKYSYKSYYKIALLVVLLIAAVLIGYLVLQECDGCTGCGSACIACTDTEWAAEYDLKGEDFITDEQLAAYFANNSITPTDVKSETAVVTGGLYRYFVLQVHSELVNAEYIEGNIDPTEQIVKGTDKRADEFIDEKALLLVKQYIILHRQFTAMGYTINRDEMTSQVNEYTSVYNQSADYYKANYIELEDFLKGAIDYDYMEGVVFGAKYASGGYDEYSLDQIKQDVNNDYIAQSYIIQYYNHDDGTAYTDAEKAATKAEFEAIIRDCKAGAKDFEAICESYETEAKTNPRVAGKKFTTVRYDVTNKDVIEMSKMAMGEYRIFEYDDVIMLMRRNVIDDAMVEYMYSRLLIEKKQPEFQQTLEGWANSLSDIKLNDSCIKYLGIVHFDIPSDY